MTKNECPLCGEKQSRDKGWHFYGYDPEAPEPVEGWCDFCGFGFTQFTKSPHDDMLKRLDDYQWEIDGQIDNIDEDIEYLKTFKEKIPELKKRIDFEALRVKLGYEKTKGGGWIKKEKPCPK